MNDDDLKKLAADMDAFSMFADEFEIGAAHSDELSGFSMVPDMPGCEEKALAENMGRIIHFGPMGGGPFILHSHDYSHLIAAVKGEISVVFEDEEIKLSCNESCVVDGKRPHSVWNRTESEATAVDVYIG